MQSEKEEKESAQKDVADAEHMENNEAKRASLEKELDAWKEAADAACAQEDEYRKRERRGRGEEEEEDEEGGGGGVRAGRGRGRGDGHGQEEGEEEEMGSCYTGASQDGWWQ